VCNVERPSEFHRDIYPTYKLCFFFYPIGFGVMGIAYVLFYIDASNGSARSCWFSLYHKLQQNSISIVIKTELVCTKGFYLN
jgi:hypothetical protein